LLCIFSFVLFFFFSSRRRHTRFSRDWSSDVCSSDLLPVLDRLATDSPDSHIGNIHSPDEPKRRILIVDDNRDACDSMATLLNLLGHEVRLAYDGIEALARVEEFSPDIVLMDVGMPNLNGYDRSEEH